MHAFLRKPFFPAPSQALIRTSFAVLVLSALALAQSGGNSTAITGTVTDPSGAVIPGAKVEIHNPVSSFDRSTTTDNAGKFAFANVPFNPYHLTVSGAGFSSYAQDVNVRSTVALDLKISLAIESSTETVNVEATAGDLIENTSTFHTDVDKDLFDKLPLESESSGLSSLVTLSSPGISADSNGLFHGLGDHAENSFTIDNQPITDQQSKVFSNQVPLESVQSMEVISGAPPAEYGGKTSVVINVTTRSGEGVTTPHGSVTASYGSFGSSNAGFDLAYGGANWGNFISVSGLDTGRFLDPPEFAVMHDKGNEENAFDRVDYKISAADSIQLNGGFTRSWFQNPNAFDNLNVGVIDPLGVPSGPTDQRSQIKTFNIAPSWTHVVNTTSVFTLSGFVRHDQYNYYPSDNPFADLGPPSLQRETVGQNRSLTNAGMRAVLNYVKGANNIKVGATYQQTLLNELDNLGVVDTTLNAPCLTAANVPVAGFTDPTQCAAAGLQPNVATNPNAPNSAFYPLFNPILLPYDLTRGGVSYAFNGHTDVKELALYAQDAVSLGNWSLNLGLRGDFYNGLSIAREAQPRVGISYNVKKTNSILRVSYARTLETPFNENLVLSSRGCFQPVIAALVPCVPSNLNPGFRNEFHAGVQQAFGKYLVFSGEYIWKYTHNAYDFSVLGNTPITFPIEWHSSKIPGYAARVSVPTLHGFSALVVFSSVAARFFTPQVGGLGTTITTGAGLPFRIDHDEKFNETTHLQYQPWKTGPWFGFNWRYDSGQVAGSVPCYGISPTNDCPQSTTLNGSPAINLTDPFGRPLTADQEFQAGLVCNGLRASPAQALPSACLASQLTSTLVKIPAPGTQNDDKNPARIAPRNLFDVSIGDDNLFRGDRYKWSLQLTAVNITNEYALYNFLSTFSGTHYVTPRTMTVALGFHF
jgi:hypothetical protein